MVMGVLSSALDLAKAAVAHDEQGALPEKVLPYYKKVRGVEACFCLYLIFCLVWSVGGGSVTGSDRGLLNNVLLEECACLSSH